jgi:predicted anti-sigma-YlaC factor YlaD
MQCAEATEALLTPEPGADPELDQHLKTCARCSGLALKVSRLDAVLQSSMLVEPPLELQLSLHQLIAAERAKPNVLATWWSWLSETLTARPHVAVAQGLAAMMLALASWQIFGWFNALNPVIGDVGYALQLLVASPAVAYLGGLQIDLQRLGLWAVVGVGGWLLSDNGLVGSRLSRRLRLP